MALAAMSLQGARVEAGGYFGFPEEAAPAPAAVAGHPQPPGCYPAPPPPPSCHVERYGCLTTNPCPPPRCDCHQYPGGTSHVCIIECDQPPTIHEPVTFTVVKNYYVPYHIKNSPHRPNVQPVNIDYRWREIHYLSDAEGNPIDRNGNPLPNPPGVIPKPGSAPHHSAPTGSPQSGSTDPAVPMDPVASAPAAEAPPVATPPVPTPAAAPAKQWVWLPQENLYGYGYQRADGLWTIDEGSRCSVPPATLAAPTPAPSPVKTASAN